MSLPMMPPFISSGASYIRMSPFLLTNYPLFLVIICSTLFNQYFPIFSVIFMCVFMKWPRPLVANMCLDVTQSLQLYLEGFLQLFKGKGYGQDWVGLSNLLTG